jgi:hypothetical protein
MAAIFGYRKFIFLNIEATSSLNDKPGGLPFKNATKTLFLEKFKGFNDMSRI